MAGCNQQINVIQINELQNNPEYYLRLLDSGRDYIFKSSDYTTLPILNRSRTGALEIVRPPFSEQTAIASRCKALFEENATVKHPIKKQIQSLKTLRSTLIAHAVTGKIKVFSTSQ